MPFETVDSPSGSSGDTDKEIEDITRAFDIAVKAKIKRRKRKRKKKQSEYAFKEELAFIGDHAFIEDYDERAD